MNIERQIIKRGIITFGCLLVTMGAMAQVFSSGGGSASGYKSTLGNQNTASGNYSIAAGWGSQATGQTSFALGYYSKAEGLNSIAMGMYTNSQSSYGITIGKGYSSTSPLLNTTGGIAMGMGSNLPTFYISPNNSQDRTGKVAIGNVTSPLAKLHIAGDAVEDADILLASTGTKKSVIKFRSSDNNITVGSDNVMKFNAPNMQFYPTGQVVVNGAFKATGNIILSGLAGSSHQVLTIDSHGQLSSTDYSTVGDNLGNHTATQNINLNGKKIINGTSRTGGIFISSSENVGINTENPQQLLHVVDGNILISKISSRPQGSTNGSILFGDTVTSTHPYGRWGIEYLDQDGVRGLNFWKTSDNNGSSSNYVLFLCSGKNGEMKGNVGIGTGTPTEKLTVNGKILAKEVIVSKDRELWPDDVFEPDYEMMSLEEVEAYVNKHHHLPEVPSAQEVGDNGVSLGDMNAILLKKIEEMTLRMIDMEKRIKELESIKNVEP